MAAREGRVATLELVVKRRDGVGPEPKALKQNTFRVENGVLVERQMGRINVHKTRTSRSSSVQCTMGNLNAYKHADRWSMRSRYVACGCGKLGLCITASIQQSVIKSCSWCPMQRKPRTRKSKALSTVSTRSAPPSQTSQDATAMRRCAKFARLSISEQRPCACPASRPALGRRSEPILTKVDRWKWASIFRQQCWKSVPMAVPLAMLRCGYIDHVRPDTQTTVLHASPAINKMLEGSSARIHALVASGRTSHARTRHATQTCQHEKAVEQRAETVARHVSARAHLPWEHGRANLKNTRHKRRLQTFCQCNGACITCLVGVEGHHGDGVVGLSKRVCVRAKINVGNHLTTPTLCRTITHLRSPRSSHILKIVNVGNYHGCRASEEVCNVPRSRVLLAVRAVMWCGVVAYDATPCRGDS